MNRMIQAQGNRCLLCLQPFERGSKVGRQPCLDHDHVTGNIRGVLCSNCNTGLGLFFDDPARLERAAAYISTGFSHFHRGSKGIDCGEDKKDHQKKW